jgi:general secretion pathway protein I
VWAFKVVERQSRAGQQGFTLIELLVAFVVALLVIGAAAPLLRRGLDYSERSSAEIAALAGARSLLARVGVEFPLAPGELRGELSGGISWRVTIEPWSTLPEPEAYEPILYRVAVQVDGPSHPGDFDLELITLRAGPPPPEDDFQ